MVVSLFYLLFLELNTFLYIKIEIGIYFSDAPYLTAFFFKFPLFLVI